MGINRYELLHKNGAEKGNHPLIYSFLGKRVIVKAADVTVEGVLASVDISEHNGFGNLLIKSGNGLILVRGSTVQIIAQRRGDRYGV